MTDSSVIIFENATLICECEAITDRDTGEVHYDNILITDKETNISRDAIELPDGLLAIAKIVGAATLEED